ncbi:c-type cytochrome biogenesis protein CcsB [Trebonia kvetii]|uniref:C-type cytochrome biogenesis protein CcsB n=1 Tax=Trebonia kvetii TaxID=2480626 RepID=A0A6P2BRI8_9ACTN|nr:c-type cytochrome biogenesis protein CcsB [Trebonia kvetii]TVZ01488.1 c-type cytochrome biogenesis protein CcsB [Trebonia kvetii]
MPVNLGFAHASNAFLIAALLIYSLAVLAFAGDYAFGRPRRAASATGVRAPARAGARLATVGAGQAPAGLDTAGLDTSGPNTDGTTADGAAGPGDGGSGIVTPAAPARSLPVPPTGAFRAMWAAGTWVRAAAVLSAVGMLAHLAAVVTRGLAVHRAPWGNMYEFITALTCVAAIFFGYIVLRYRAWTLGVFVMGAVVLSLGLAETLIYTPAGPLVPALQSYWLSIHVTAMTLATGIFFVAAVLGIMYLIAERYRKRVEAGKAQPGNGLIARIPSAQTLDKLTYRTVVFGFPVWTFGVIAGAIWADQAWGRYWGWDPVETWAFITWVIYAAYLHARATAGWRGARAHYIQLLGFASLVTNMLVVQVFITGMHSYAGVSG